MTDKQRHHLHQQTPGRAPIAGLPNWLILGSAALVALAAALLRALG